MKAWKFWAVLGAALVVAVFSAPYAGWAAGQEGEEIRGTDGTNSIKIKVDSSGNLSTAGNVASGATDSGNPVKIGGVYNSTKPTLSNGQRGDVQLDTRARVFTVVCQEDTLRCATVPSTLGDDVAYQGGLAVSAQNWNFDGSTYDREFSCGSSAVINVSAAATTELVALTASQVIRVCSFVISGDTAATTATFVYGTGSNCATGQTALTGAMRMVDEGNISSTGMQGSLFRTAASNALCLTAATGAVTGFVTYAKY